MKLQLGQLWQQLGAAFGRMPGRRKLLVALAGLGSLALVAWLALRGTNTRYAVLYSGLAPEDASDAVASLRGQGVPYKLEADGHTILVPVARVPELRLAMAAAGLPRGGGIGFEVFDKSSLGTTSFVEQMNYRRALQGELSRTILGLDSVERARVHVAMPERSLYRELDDTPSASVVLRMKRGRVLGPAQVRGIVHLVSSSVEGMRPERVTVIDERGTILSADESAALVSDDQRQLEHSLAQRIQLIVERLTGPGRAVVAVSADLERAQTERTEEIWDKDRSALRSESRSSEGDVGGAGTAGVAGARGNLPGAPAPSAAAGPGGVGNGRLSETRNFEISRVLSKTLGPRSSLRRLSVAILVDASPPSALAAAAVPAVPGKPGAAPAAVPAAVPVAAAAPDLAQIEALAREAVGFDAARGDRIEVKSAPFFVDTGDAEGAGLAAHKRPWKPGVRELAMAGGGALVLLVVVVLLLKRAGKQAKARGAVAQLMPVALPATVQQLERAMPSIGNVAGHLTGAGSSPRERALDAARRDGERAARVLASWMSEPAGGQGES